MNKATKNTSGVKPNYLRKQWRAIRKYPARITIILVSLIVLLLFTFLTVDNLSTQKQSSTNAATTTSPYVCGANTDSQMSSQYPQAKQYGVTTIRLGYGPTWVSNIQAVKSAGLQPLIILHGCGTTDPTLRLQGNIQMVQQAQQVFGASSRIFYEIGNENDLQCGLSAAAYTSMWNAMVPQLKQAAPNSWFGGPVNFQQNPAYVSSFVHSAVPKPDFVSWHEYTCGSTSPNATCISHIANWSTHITNTKSAITGNGDTVPPIFITEWNYAPDGGVATDTKHNDPTFMTQWTNTALQTLIQNNVYESNQFNVTNATPLLGSAQGQAFKTICLNTATTPGGGAVSTPTSSPLTPIVNPTYVCAGGINCVPSLSPTPTSAAGITSTPFPTAALSNIPLPSSVNPTTPVSITPIGNNGNTSGIHGLIELLLKLLEQLLNLLKSLLGGI